MTRVELIPQFTPIHSFNVVIEDLEPEAKYYYKVGNKSNGYSKISSFTAPMDPDQNKSFSFVYFTNIKGHLKVHLRTQRSYMIISKKMNKMLSF